MGNLFGGGFGVSGGQIEGNMRLIWVVCEEVQGEWEVWDCFGMEELVGRFQQGCYGLIVFIVGCMFGQDRGSM